jgi:hypothetical protein
MPLVDPFHHLYVAQLAALRLHGESTVILAVVANTSESRPLKLRNSCSRIAGIRSADDATPGWFKNSPDTLRNHSGSAS